MGTMYVYKLTSYYEYQNYFIEQQRNVFSLKKLPFIFMLFYIKFIMFYSYISFFISKNKINRFDKFYIFIVTLSFLYIGIARGTNFEFFEFIMIIIFIMLSKQRGNKFKIPIKSLFIVGVLVSIMIYVFYIRISARGVIFNFTISRDVFYDSYGIIPLISPFFSFLVLILYGYFGFGFFYMATYLSDMWLISTENFIAGLIPFGYLAMGGSSLHNTMKNLVDMGAKWQPDSAVFINNFGYVGLILICFLMGVFSKYIQTGKDNAPISQLTSFIILLQMVSLPVGNFITTSSASQLIVISLALYWIWKIFIKVKIKL